MATTISLYKGRRELTMAQYEAIGELDIDKDYNIIDYPDLQSIKNSEMEIILNYTRLFKIGTIVTCGDEGTYLLGHQYQLQLIDDIRTWVDLTAKILNDNITTVLNTPI